MSAPRRDWTTDVGIGVVGVAAAILTFTTLRDLALACGITGELWKLKLAYLVPVTVDAAGVIATRVWLRGTDRPEAVRFARGLAWSCIVASVVGNAGQHGMAAYRLIVPWWVVVLVSAVPPAMLGAVVHLGHLRTAVPDRQTADRTDVETGLAVSNVETGLAVSNVETGPDWTDPWTAGPDQTGTQVSNVETGSAVPNVETGPDWTDPWDRWAGPDERTAFDVVTGPTGPGPDQDRTSGPRRTDPLLPEVVRWAAERTGPVSQRQIRSEFNVGAERAKKLMDQMGVAA